MNNKLFSCINDLNNWLTDEVNKIDESGDSDAKKAYAILVLLNEAMNCMRSLLQDYDYGFSFRVFAMPDHAWQIVDVVNKVAQRVGAVVHLLKKLKKTDIDNDFIRGNNTLFEKIKNAISKLGAAIEEAEQSSNRRRTRETKTCYHHLKFYLWPTIEYKVMINFPNIGSENNEVSTPKKKKFRQMLDTFKEDFLETSFDHAITNLKKAGDMKDEVEVFLYNVRVEYVRLFVTSDKFTGEINRMKDKKLNEIFTFYVEFFKNQLDKNMQQDRDVYFHRWVLEAHVTQAIDDIFKKITDLIGEDCVSRILGEKEKLNIQTLISSKKSDNADMSKARKNLLKLFANIPWERHLICVNSG